MKRAQLAINSISTAGASLPERLEAYKAAGFDNAEFYLGHVHEYIEKGNSPDAVRALLDDHGLRSIGGFEGTLNTFGSLTELEENRTRVIQNAELIATLGGGTLVVGTDGPFKPHDDPLGAMADRFAQVAAEFPVGVNLAIEFNWGPIVKSLRTAAEISRRSSESNVGILFDTAHYHCTPTKLDQINVENVALIKQVHLNDMRDKPGELSNCNSDRELPGEGILDVKGLTGRIEELGYRGYFAIEMFSDYLWSLPAADAARQMYQSLLPLCSD